MKTNTIAGPHALNLIAVARRTDQVCAFVGGDTFEATMKAALDRRSVRTIASIMHEMAADLGEYADHLLLWDKTTKMYEVVEQPAGYVTEDKLVVAGPYGNGRA